MGRILDALTHADNTAGEASQPRATPPNAAAEDAHPMCVAAEEIPFIEVGPRKSMEASPSVLACSPASAALPLSRTALPAPRSEPPPSQPAPRSVRFQAVPGRAARSSFATELVAHHAPDQPAAQQYRDVLDAVRNASSASDRPSALLFTSSLPRSGATTTLLNLAITAAGERRQRVLVVDANFRRPAVAERLGLPAAPGLREAMAGTAALDEVIQATELANLFVLTAGIRDTSGVRFVAETLRSLLRQLRQRYPLLFVDGPRWDGKSDIRALGAACDAVFLVTPETEAETPQTDALLRLIAEQGAQLAGCILVADPSTLH
ncbi:MAG: CpsD/CapB family tyrosine-protein kinase [Gemmataceae bacterium]